MNFLKNLIKRALVTLDRIDSNGQCSYLGTVSNYEAVKPYGLASIPKQSDKPLIVMLNIGGDESNKVGFEYNNKFPFVTETMEAGEVVVFNPTNQDSYVIFKNDGETKLVGEKIALGNSATELLQQISEEIAELSTTLTNLAVHVHPTAAVGAPSIPTNAAAYTASKVVIDAIKVKVDSIKGTI